MKITSPIQIALLTLLTANTYAQSVYYDPSIDFSNVGPNGGVVKFVYTSNDATTGALIGLPSTFSFDYQLSSWSNGYTWDANSPFDVAEELTSGSSSATMTFLSGSIPVPTGHSDCYTVSTALPSLSTRNAVYTTEFNDIRNSFGYSLSATPTGSTPYSLVTPPSQFNMSFINEGFTTIPNNISNDLIISNSRYGSEKEALYVIDPNCVPEPSSTALLGLGGIALILRRKK